MLVAVSSMAYKHLLPAVAYDKVYYETQEKIKIKFRSMANILPVITLYQPWATWIMREWKTIETRTHNRFASLIHRTVLIHAGQRTDDSDLTVKNPYLTKEQILHEPDEVINGAILGSVYVDACGWLCGDSYENKSALIETTNRYGLFLKDAKRFDEPLYVKGEMGIWYYDLDAKQKVKKPITNAGQEILF